MKQCLLRLMACATTLVLMTTACSSRSTTPSKPTPLPNGMVGGSVDVGGRKLFYKCSGEGSPTVILEAGGDSDSAYWDLVMTYFGGTSRICAYDRANLGSSDSAPRPRSAEDMVHDLRALLMNAQIGGPYILVGHSGGGLLVRLFADQYPAEVAGMVLVDAAHPEMGTRLLVGLPPESAHETESLSAYRQWFTWMSGLNESTFHDLEGWDMLAVNGQVKAAKALGDLPLVVISRNPENALLVDSMPTLPAETTAKLSQIWQDLQSELVGLSCNSAQVFAQGGHNIPGDEPKLIVEVLRKQVNEVRNLAVKNPAAEKNTAGDLIDASHMPKILRVVERQARRDGRLIINKDVYFTDDAGDAAVAEISLVSGDLGEGQHFRGGLVTASAVEQKHEAMETATWVCYTQGTFVLEMKIVDGAGNSSEPVNLTFPCPAPQDISSFLIIGLIAGLGLSGLAAWLLVHYSRARRVTTSPDRVP